MISLKNLELRRVETCNLIFTLRPGNKKKEADYPKPENSKRQLQEFDGLPLKMARGECRSVMDPADP